MDSICESTRDENYFEASIIEQYPKVPMKSAEKLANNLPQ